MLKKGSNRKEIGNVLNSIGYIYQYELGELIASIPYYEEAIRVYASIEENRGMIKPLNNLGNIFFYNCNYAKALEYQSKALEFALKSESTKDIAISYLNIGSIYYRLGDYDSVEEHYKMALKYFNDMPDSLRSLHMPLILSNIGTVFKDKGNIDSALFYHKKALSFETRNLSSSKIINNIARIHLHRQDYKNALYYNRKSLSFLTDTSGVSESCWAYFTRGEIYHSNQMPDSAIFFYQKALKIAEDKMLIDKIKIANKKLSEIYQAQNKQELALTHYMEYERAKDSLYKAENAKEITQMQMQHEFDIIQQKQLAEQQQKDLEIQIALRKKNNTITIFGLIIFILSLIIGIAVLTIRNNKLRDTQEKVLLEQKLLRSQMTPHFIFNSLGIIQSFIQENMSSDAINYLTRFSSLLRFVLEGSREEYIPFEKEIEMLDNYMEVQKVAFDTNFNHAIEVDRAIESKRMLVPPMLIQPFIENAIKHGFLNKPEHGKITVQFKLDNDSLMVEINDNGIGIERAKAQKKNISTDHTSLAMVITEERLKNLKIKKDHTTKIKSLEVKSEKGAILGTSVIFEIPYKQI